MLFLEKPDDFHGDLDVVGCFVEYDGKIVLLQRGEHRPEPGKWGMPAGKVHAGEEMIDAMKRELWEETGIKNDQLEHLRDVFARAPGKDITYHMFRCKLDTKPEIMMSPGEHVAFRWVTPEEVPEMDFIHDLDACVKLVY